MFVDSGGRGLSCFVDHHIYCGRQMIMITLRIPLATIEGTFARGALGTETYIAVEVGIWVFLELGTHLSKQVRFGGLEV